MARVGECMMNASMAMPIMPIPNAYPFSKEFNLTFPGSPWSSRIATSEPTEGSSQLLTEYALA